MHIKKLGESKFVTECKTELTRSWGDGENGKFLVNTKVGMIKKILNMDGGDGCTTLNALNETEWYT